MEKKKPERNLRKEKGESLEMVEHKKEKTMTFFSVEVPIFSPEDFLRDSGVSASKVKFPVSLSNNVGFMP